VIIFTERPVFVLWIAFLAQLPFQVFFTFWGGGFFGGMSSSLLHIHGPYLFIGFGALAFVGFPCAACIGKYLNYSRTLYNFYEDRLEFEEGFFSRNKKVIRYRDILEVTLRRGILQQTCNLGTIYLATLATGSGSRTNPFYALGFGNISASGVGVRDIRDPEASFAKVRALIDAKRG
jgi:membrane protein YdbS with pleckstrin-like domain